MQSQFNLAAVCSINRNSKIKSVLNQALEAITKMTIWPCLTHNSRKNHLEGLCSRENQVLDQVLRE